MTQAGPRVMPGITPCSEQGSASLAPPTPTRTGAAAIARVPDSDENVIAGGSSKKSLQQPRLTPPVGSG